MKNRKYTYLICFEFSLLDGREGKASQAINSEKKLTARLLNEVIEVLGEMLKERNGIDVKNIVFTSIVELDQEEGGGDE